MPTEQISRYFQVASSERGVAVEVEERRGRERRRLDRHPHAGRGGGRARRGVIIAEEDEQARRRRRGSARSGAERAGSRARRASRARKRTLTTPRTSCPSGSSRSQPPERRPDARRQRERRRRARGARRAPTATSQRPPARRDGHERRDDRGERSGNEDRGRAPSLTPSAASERSVSSEENSRLMWLMMMPMTKMPTNRSSSTPTSTRNGIASMQRAGRR